MIENWLLLFIAAHFQSFNIWISINIMYSCILLLNGYNIWINIYPLPHREIYLDHAKNESMWHAVCSKIHGPTEIAHSSSRIWMLHDLCPEGGPDATCDMATKQCYSQYQHQLPYHQHLWRLLFTYIESWTQRHRGV